MATQLDSTQAERHARRLDREDIRVTLPPTYAPRRATAVVDLHAHVLHGLDDGPETLDEALAVVRAAAEAGTGTIVATPHVSAKYPTSARHIADRVAELSRALAAHRVPVDVVPGAEVAFDMLETMGLDELRALTLGGTGASLLVEFPYAGWPADLAAGLQRLLEAGIRPVLAHPERNDVVQQAPFRLEPLMRHGVVMQVTASSLRHRRRDAVGKAARFLVESSLAHVIASDTHGRGTRTPQLDVARRSVGDPVLFHWLTQDVPAALVAGGQLPALPPSSPARTGRFSLRGTLRR